MKVGVHKKTPQQIAFAGVLRGYVLARTPVVQIHFRHFAGLGDGLADISTQGYPDLFAPINDDDFHREKKCSTSTSSSRRIAVCDISN